MAAGQVYLTILLVLLSLPASASPKKPDLAEPTARKLYLETRALEREARWATAKEVLTMLGSLGGIGGILWTIGRGFGELRLNRQQRELEGKRHKEERVSALLNALSHGAPEIRAGAATGLSRYADDVAAELLLRLQYEENQLVVHAIRTSLGGVNDFSPILKASSATLRARVGLLGGLAELGTDMSAAESALGLVGAVQKTSPASQRADFRAGQRLARTRLAHRVAIATLRSEEGDLYELVRRDLLQEGVQRAQLAHACVHLIQLRLQKRHPEEHLVLRGTDLAGIDLFRMNLEKMDFSDCLLTNALGWKADFTGCLFVNASSTGANLERATLNDALFEQSSLVRMRLRHCCAVGLKVTHCELSGFNASQGNFSKLQLQDSWGEGVRMNGTSLRNAVLRAVKLHQLKAAGADMSECEILDAELYRASLEGAVLMNARLRNVKLNGADLRRADFTGAILENVDLRGAKLTGATISESQLDACMRN